MEQPNENKPTKPVPAAPKPKKPKKKVKFTRADPSLVSAIIHVESMIPPRKSWYNQQRNQHTPAVSCSQDHPPLATAEPRLSRLQRPPTRTLSAVRTGGQHAPQLPPPPIARQNVIPTTPAQSQNGTMPHIEAPNVSTMTQVPPIHPYIFENVISYSYYSEPCVTLFEQNCNYLDYFLNKDPDLTSTNLFNETKPEGPNPEYAPLTWDEIVGSGPVFQFTKPATKKEAVQLSCSNVFETTATQSDSFKEAAVSTTTLTVSCPITCETDIPEVSALGGVCLLDIP